MNHRHTNGPNIVARNNNTEANRVDTSPHTTIVALETANKHTRRANNNTA